MLMLILKPSTLRAMRRRQAPIGTASLAVPASNLICSGAIPRPPLSRGAAMTGPMIGMRAPLPARTMRSIFFPGSSERVSMRRDSSHRPWTDGRMKLQMSP